MRVLVTSLIVCCIVSAAQADLVGLEPEAPLLDVSDLHVKYKANDGTLNVWTTPHTELSYSPDGVSWFTGTGSLSLTMEVNPDDGSLISGSMTMTTDAGEEGFPESTTTTADLSQFGYDFDTGTLDFQFVDAVGEGDNPFIEAVTQPIAALNVIVTLGALDSNPWPLDFTKSWSNQGKGSASVGIPEPSTVALLALGALGLIRRRRRRR